jgi:hypothetical protein
VEFLYKAEEMQESQEPTQESQSIKSKRKTGKRQHSSTPFGQLGSEDEAEQPNQETQAEEKIDAADGDVGSVYGRFLFSDSRTELEDQVCLCGSIAIACHRYFSWPLDRGNKCASAFSR